ncbi:MAG: isochorismatase family protein [Armatimonadetes bacterium]|nr:isochorismatase family protein [Armatimonadota bacterium]
MPSAILTPENSLVLVVDMQSKFLAPIFEAERVEARCRFLCQVAQLFEVPILATEQYPERMGGTIDSLLPFVGQPHRKMEFSAFGQEEFGQLVKLKGRTNLVVVGIETHICVSQSCHHALSMDLTPVICPDAASSRTQDRHKLGMERLRDAGVVPAHTEAVAYEWCRTADNPKFRDLLSVVKGSAF